MKIIKIFVLLVTGVTTVFIVGFVYLFGGMTDGECLYADRVEIIGKTNNSHLLTLKTSGFQEKILILELYKSNVKFNTCGEANIKALYSEAIDDSAGVFIKDVTVNNEKIIVNYTNKKTEAISIESLKSIYGNKT